MYQLCVENGQVVTESGFFFKARPFEVKVGERLFSLIFRKGSLGKVIYALEENSQLLAELAHPYYAPEFAPEDSHRFGEDAPVVEAVYAALVHLGVTRDKVWLAYFQDKKRSFVVTQA